MDIYTVRDNLVNTIAGKEMLLATYSEKEQLGVYPKTLEYRGMCGVLEININELKRILKDVEQCAKKASNDSWMINADRSGGGFTAEEINNQGWK
jgi:hypothetical protein